MSEITANINNSLNEDVTEMTSAQLIVVNCLKILTYWLCVLQKDVHGSLIATQVYARLGLHVNVLVDLKATTVRQVYVRNGVWPSQISLKMVLCWESKFYTVAM